MFGKNDAVLEIGFVHCVGFDIAGCAQHACQSSGMFGQFVAEPFDRRQFAILAEAHLDVVAEFDRPPGGGAVKVQTARLELIAPAERECQRSFKDAQKMFAIVLDRRGSRRLQLVRQPAAGGALRRAGCKSFAKVC